MEKELTTTERLSKQCEEWKAAAYRAQGELQKMELSRNRWRAKADANRALLDFIGRKLAEEGINDDE